MSPALPNRLRLVLALVLLASVFGGLSTPSITSAAATLKSISASGSVTGGGDITIKVSLTAAATTATTVQLKSNRPSVITVPATIVVPKSKSSQSITVTTRSSNQQADVTLTAKLGSISKTKVVTVKPPALSSVSLPESVEAGKAFNVTVRLNSKAPSGGMNVILSSNNPSRLPVPATVKVPGGSTGVAVRVTSTEGADATAQVTAALNGITKNDSITIVTNVRTYDFQFNLDPVPNQGDVTLTLTLNKPLPTGNGWGVYSFSQTWVPSNGCFGGLLPIGMFFSNPDGETLVYSQTVQAGFEGYSPEAGDDYVIALCSYPHGSSGDRTLVYYERFAIYDVTGGASESSDTLEPVASPVDQP